MVAYLFCLVAPKLAATNVCKKLSTVLLQGIDVLHKCITLSDVSAI